jgi:hypothetical protein
MINKNYTEFVDWHKMYDWIKYNPASYSGGISLNPDPETGYLN